ncbi:UNVERIFIED_CONTAM: hypothetical protein FKN15_046588 [Acipenser sinensis]
MDATQFAEMLDLLRQTLTAVAQVSAGPAGPDPQLMRPTKMTAEDRPEAYLWDGTVGSLKIGRGQQPINIRLSVMAVTRRDREIIMLTLPNNGHCQRLNHRVQSRNNNTQNSTQHRHGHFF